MNPSLKYALRSLVPSRLLRDRERSYFLHQLETDLFMSMPGETKRAFVANASRVLRYPVFIETGTFRGDMALAASGHFREVHSIELDPALARQAAARCAGRTNITIHEGDSARLLTGITSGLRESAVFWLDAHYSGSETARGDTDTPVLQELEVIAAHPVRPHAVFVDDARVFGMDNAYPPLEAIISRLRAIDPEFRIGVSSDIIWASRTKLLDFHWVRRDDGLIIQPSTLSRAPG